MDQIVATNQFSESILYAGVPEGYECLVIPELVSAGDTVLFVLRDDKRISTVAAGLQFFAPEVEVIQLPAWDCLPYDRISPRNDIVAKRIFALTELIVNRSTNRRIILLSVSAFLQRVPARSVFKDTVLTISKKDEFSRDNLLEYLDKNGYGRTETVMEPGEYALRGGIIDLFPPGQKHPVRLDIFGDDLESIRTFDPLSQLSSGTLKEFSLRPVQEFWLDNDSIIRFRTGYRELFGAIKETDPLYEAVSDGRTHMGMEHWLPLFHKKLETVLDYVPLGSIVLDYQIPDACNSRWELIFDCYDARSTITAKNHVFSSMLYNPLPVNRLYLDRNELSSLVNTRQVIQLQPYSAPDTSDRIIDKGGKPGRNFSDVRARQDINVFGVLKEYIDTEVRAGRRTILACHSHGSRDRMISAIADYGIAASKTDANWKSIETQDISIVNAVVMPIERGFRTSVLNVIGEQDILGERLYNPSKRKIKQENFIAETSVLSAGDLIVHAEHGIGRFDELVMLTIAGANHDCLVLVYSGGDKLFLPVENIDVISRYGQDGSDVRLDKLGGLGWQARKSKLKKLIRETAEKLIAVAAARQLEEGEVYRPDKGAYDEFCTGFAFEETEDQAQAINDVINDMSTGRPMDRLICGDVGFGKTEVALRAAFVVALEGKQVAVLVPTTLLARQHFQVFNKRFAEFPVRICELSRLVSVHDLNETKQGLADGTIDIVIGTHALLSKEIKFHRLGLLIIDEEQHFGVTHKERIKQLKSSVHVLTLTATPIPRTLQLALTGIRDLSLITTPPIDRLAVRTFILPKDPMVLSEAIQRERNRGGQIFYVCPRIKDIPRLRTELSELVPGVKVAVAHGQLSPKNLEMVMSAFYEGAFDLLLTTNIIESGLDLPTVNTIIIHRADQFGLSQLYQLRGRIGRSKVRGYAYLTLPENQKLTVTAEKRLGVMQRLDNLGAGFMLASHDLDIRGAGNLLGDEQSGHIREVGIELYQQMLEVAVAESKVASSQPELDQNQWVPQIDVGIPVLIPADYIPDLGVRMLLYRRIAALNNRAEMDSFAAELIDRFGVLPPEVENLLSTVNIKRLCHTAGIEKLEAGPKGATISFRNNVFANPAELIDFITSQSGTTKLRPDHKLVFRRNWDEEPDRLTGVKYLARQLAEIAQTPVTRN